ncbi:MAG: sodium-dependent transporter, partial [Candidatus Dadabacteria bacterium]
AFVLVYLAAVALVGVPLLVAEVLIGRSARRNPVGAFRTLRPGRAWPLVGWLGVVTGFVILSYYGVVAGWAVEYCWRSLTGRLADLEAMGVDAAFEALIHDGPRQVFWQGLFMIATVVVVARGIEAGIEQASRVLMPLLFALILVLLGYAITSPGASEGLRFLLQPRFEELGWNGVLQALGQAFFSLSLGMGAMITYGSYLEPDKKILQSAFYIAGMDTLLAVLAGLVIFPLVFSFGLEPGAGPGLIFITLPKAFLMMPASNAFAAVFFLLVLFAALTSAISLLEVVVSFAVDEYGIARGPASWGAGAVIFLLGVPSAVVSGFLGHVDAVASNWMLPVGGLATAIFVGWGLSREEAAAGYVGSSGSRGGFRAWHICIRFIVPVAVGVILLQNTGLLG